MSKLPPTSLSFPPPLADFQAKSPIALFVDFDGTLIEIAAAPEAIMVPPDLPQRLDALASRLGGRLALVSGRALDNIAGHLAPLNIARAGSHGAERVDQSGKVLGVPPRALDAPMVDALQQVAGRYDILLEHKSHGAALHYRAAPQHAAAIHDAADAIALQFGLITKRGKCVVELVRPGADKGVAVAAFMQTALFMGATPLFIGDDITDEQGFAVAKKMGGAGIAVGDRPSANASFKLDTVKDVYAWLNL